ncbi:MAG: hypothetical protein LQ341_006463, partial [Variospora aurantia]
NQAREWADLVHKLLKQSVRVWDAVKGILCADAPEGYEIGISNELTVGTKDLLSYCWRALKESSWLSFGTEELSLLSRKPSPSVAFVVHSRTTLERKRYRKNGIK